MARNSVSICLFGCCFLRFFTGMVLGWSMILPVRGLEMPFIEVDPHTTAALRAHKTGAPFVAVGVNYFGPHMGWAPKLWRDFEVELVERHLRMIRESGFNTVRVFLTHDAFHRDPGIVHAKGVEKFKKFLAVCRNLGIYVVPSGPDHWEGVPTWRRGADTFADEALLQADETWWRAFTAMFQNEPAILAWDLLNEPAIQWQTPAMKHKWNQWLKEKYVSVKRLAEAHDLSLQQVGELGSIEVPKATAARDCPRLYDYQLFRESIADAWSRRMVAAIRRGDPRHLVTIGHIQWAGTVFLPSVRDYAGFNLKENAQHVDLVTIHFYPLSNPRPSDGPKGIEHNGDYLAALLQECSVGKPVMLGEFAWYGGGDVRLRGQMVMPPQTVDDQLAWNTKLLEVSRGRVCGWLHWAFADTPTSHDLTRWSGLWTEDLALKPWGARFSRFAREITQSPDRPQSFSPDLQLPILDRRAILTDPGSVERTW